MLSAAVLHQRMEGAELSWTIVTLNGFGSRSNILYFPNLKVFFGTSIFMKDKNKLLGRVNFEPVTVSPVLFTIYRKVEAAQFLFVQCTTVRTCLRQSAQFVYKQVNSA